jgi:hypothetical protein
MDDENNIVPTLQKGGVEPLIMSSAMYLGHVLVSLIHHNQITGHDILDVYEQVDNNLARSEIAYAVENEMRNQTIINIKEFAKKHRIKDELKKIKKNREIASLKKDLKEPLTELLENAELEEALVHHNYRKKVILTEEDEDLYAKSIFSERILDKISLNIDEVIEIVENVDKTGLNADQKRILKMIQNFVYLYKFFKDNRSHMKYDSKGNRVFVVEGNLKSRSKSASNKPLASTSVATVKHRKFKFKTMKKKANALKRAKTMRRVKSLSIEKKQAKSAIKSNVSNKSHISNVASAA